MLFSKEGGTEDPVLIGEIDVDSADFDPLNPSIKVEIDSELASSLDGANACFQVLAVNRTGESQPATAPCIAL